MFVGHSLFTCFSMHCCHVVTLISLIFAYLCVCVCARKLCMMTLHGCCRVCVCVSVCCCLILAAVLRHLSLSFSLSSISCSGDSGSSSSAGLSSETASSLPSESFSPEQQSCVSPLLLILCVLLIMILWVKMGEDSLEELVRRLTVIVHKIGRRSCE